MIQPEPSLASAPRPLAVPAPLPPTSAGPTQGLAALSDTQLVLVIATMLFALSAWPLLLVDLPPFQDLPNHLATAHIIAHPDIYPEFTFNGFLKSNSLLNLWLYAFGGLGLFGAARAFTALVLALNALALPILVLRFAGRRCLVVAALFVWPLVHGSFVSRGFLNFEVAFALSLMALAVLDRQRERPTVIRGIGIALLAGAIWYAHPFPLAVVGALVALHAVTRSTWPARLAAGLALLPPLVPAGLLSLVAAERHLVKTEHATAFGAASSSFLNPWRILLHFWTDASGALTRWGSMTVVPAILLVWFVWKQRRVTRPFLSLPAMAILTAAYVGLPVMLSNWWYLSCRLVPFLWAGLAVRLPNKLPRAVGIALAACALTSSVALGIDYVRLDHDRAEFTAGMDAVPTRATLLPLLFAHSKTGDFSTSLTHAWGYYTVLKDASAPLVFAVERSYPITYRDFPPSALVPPALDRFAEVHATPARVCRLLRLPPDDAACVVAWRAAWDSFWKQAEPRFSHVLTWAIPGEARSIIPESYHRVFAKGDLEIYARETPAADSSRTQLERQVGTGR